MKQKTKRIIYTWIYQFLGLGTIFWIGIYGRQTPLMGKVIAPLYSLQDNHGVNAWGLILILFGLIGLIGIFIQRKIHIKYHDN